MTCPSRVASRWIGALAKQALRQKTLKVLLEKNGSFGVMSAYTRTGKHENQDRHGQLVADLQKMGYRQFENLRGQWDGVAENSVLIPKINPSDLFDLGRKYGQDSVIYKSHEGIIGMYYTKANYAEVAVNPDASPSFKILDNDRLWSKPNKDWSFEFGFLWGKHVPWDGHSPLNAQDIQQVLPQAA